MLTEKSDSLPAKTLTFIHSRFLMTVTGKSLILHCTFKVGTLVRSLKSQLKRGLGQNDRVWPEEQGTSIQEMTHPPLEGFVQ